MKYTFDGSVAIATVFVLQDGTELVAHTGTCLHRKKTNLPFARVPTLRRDGMEDRWEQSCVRAFSKLLCSEGNRSHKYRLQAPNLV